ncbi:MAG: hypothetical protein OEZ02_12825 [Anaerolineae bacterium]|nr:hypothetical protein [Anaerolineae bacterium]
MVRDQATFGRYDQYGPGEVVELTDEEAAAFADKVIPAGRASAGQAAAKPPAAAPKPARAAAQPPAEADQTPDDAPQYDKRILKVVELGGLESPEDLRSMSDEQILAIDAKVGPGVLKVIRAAVGFEPQE